MNNINAEQQLTKSRCNTDMNTVRKCEKPCSLLMTILKERDGMWKIIGIMYGVTGENFILRSEQALKILCLWTNVYDKAFWGTSKLTFDIFV